MHQPRSDRDGRAHQTVNRDSIKVLPVPEALHNPLQFFLRALGKMRLHILGEAFPQIIGLPVQIPRQTTPLRAYSIIGERQGDQHHSHYQRNY